MYETKYGCNFLWKSGSMTQNVWHKKGDLLFHVRKLEEVQHPLLMGALNLYLLPLVMLQLQTQYATFYAKKFMPDMPELGGKRGAPPMHCSAGYA